MVEHGPRHNGVRHYAIMPFASHELLTDVTNQIAAHVMLYNDQNIHDINNWPLTMAALECTLMTRREDVLVEKLHHELIRLYNLTLDPQNYSHVGGYILTWGSELEFILATHAWYRQRDTGHAQGVQKVIEDVEQAGIYGLNHYMKGQWQHITQGQSNWHNHQVIPTPIPNPDNPRQLSGLTFKRIRQHLKLSLADVSVSWTVATQSRFENMKTQFGFITINKLIDALMMSRSVLFTQIDSYRQNIIALDSITKSSKKSQTSAEHMHSDIEKAKNTIPSQPQNVHNLRVGDLYVKAILVLYGDGLKPEDAWAAMDFDSVRKTLVESITSFKWLQPSDLDSITLVISMLDNEEVATIWRYVYTHSRFDFTVSYRMYGVVLTVFAGYAMAADIPHLRQLDQIFGQTQSQAEPRTAIAIRALQLTCQLFLHPEQAAETIAEIDKSMLAMNRLRHNIPTVAVTAGNHFNVLHDIMVPFFQKWWAEQQEK